MILQINDVAPDFEAETTEGRIRFHEWIGDAWCMLFSSAKGLTPVCASEVRHLAKLKPEFDRRGAKIIGLSVDTVGGNRKSAGEIKQSDGLAGDYPLIDDADLRISKLYGMIPATVASEVASATLAYNQTARNVFLIGPDKRIGLITFYPAMTERNFDEILRVLDSLQATLKQAVAKPVGKLGEEVAADQNGAPEQPAHIPEISREEIQRRLHDPSLLVVDVLPRQSYLAEHIPGAISLPLAEVESRAREVLPDLTAELAIYCAKFT